MSKEKTSLEKTPILVGAVSSSNKYKKGTKPKREFNPSKNAEDFIQDIANAMGVSVEEAMERIEKFSDELDKLRKV
jgi:methylmalonyl-CoA mutase cobalamin-binding subunit